MEDLCKDCSESVRGLCCCMNIPIGDFNIVLENVCCPYLDKETMRCSDFENRTELAPWCQRGEKMFGTGSLPVGCLYLEEDPQRELHPKQRIQNILPQLPNYKRIELVGKYNFFNNIPFKKYIEYIQLHGAILE